MNMINETPVLQHFHIDGVKHIHPLGLSTSPDGFVLVDIRENEEINPDDTELHISQLHIPTSLFSSSLDLIPTDKKIVIMCAHGIRSVRICSWLMGFGFENVLNLDGGFAIWMKLRESL